MKLIVFVVFMFGLTSHAFSSENKLETYIENFD